AGGAMDAERVYVPLQSERIVALRRTDGSRVWTRDIEARWRRVVIGDAVYIVASDEMHALDAATGTERWRVPFEHQLTAPLAATTWIAAGGTERSLVAVADKGLVIAVAAADGRTIWMRELGALSRFTP